MPRNPFDPQDADHFEEDYDAAQQESAPAAEQESCQRCGTRLDDSDDALYCGHCMGVELPYFSAPSPAQDKPVIGRNLSPDAPRPTGSGVALPKSESAASAATPKENQ